MGHTHSSAVAKPALTIMSVDKQIENMVSFIQQEAREKAMEITVKAEEEASIEKNTMIRKGQDKISEHYAKLAKQTDIKRQIYGSTLESEKSLNVLRSREEKLLQCVEEARKKLA